MGSSPTAGTEMTLGLDGQAVGCNPIPSRFDSCRRLCKFFRCSSHGKSVRLKSGRPLARTQPPELNASMM